MKGVVLIDQYNFNYYNFNNINLILIIGFKNTVIVILLGPFWFRN